MLAAGAGLKNGSSPRVRGKRYRLDQTVNQGGLIPACAGKTVLAGDDPVDGRAHPRVCGENMRTSAASAEKPGSSPRVRGKH